MATKELLLWVLVLVSIGLSILSFVNTNVRPLSSNAQGGGRCAEGFTYEIIVVNGQNVGACVKRVRGRIVQSYQN